MVEIERLEKLGLEAGFSHVALLDCSTIELKEEVRQMCEANTCHKYGRCWSCPPGCGTLEECREKVGRYRWGILVQTVGELEDALDGETMMETEALHKEHFYAFEKILRQQYPSMLAIGAGCCTKCKTCTCPDAPCRFPDQSFSSMEAFGMLVTQVCQANHLAYYYGPCTIAYTSCYLLV
jgi:predicted metal-binding protein